MKRNMTLTIFGSVLGILILISGAQLCASGQESGNERSIEGVWRTNVTPVNCQTGNPVAPAFPGLLGFNKGGTLAGTSTVATSAHGVWKREGGWENYTFAFSNLRYNASGVYIGSQTVRQTAKLAASRNEFTSSGTVEVFDTNGNVVGNGCAAAIGTRFE
jgi:hypothetical protein